MNLENKISYWKHHMAHYLKFSMMVDDQFKNLLNDTFALTSFVYAESSIKNNLVEKMCEMRKVHKRDFCFMYMGNFPWTWFETLSDILGALVEAVKEILKDMDNPSKDDYKQLAEQIFEELFNITDFTIYYRGKNNE